MTATQTAGPTSGSAPSRRLLPGEAWLIALFALTAVFVTWQKLHLGHLDNFLIFRWSFFHLSEGVNLYAPYPNQYLSLFQYGPSFGLLIAPFAPAKINSKWSARSHGVAVGPPRCCASPTLTVSRTVSHRIGHAVRHP